MKALKIEIIKWPFLLLLVMANLNGLAQTDDKKNQQKEYKYQELKNLIESHQYRFEATKANPGKGRQVDMTTRNNYMTVDKNNAVSKISYFGRAYSGGYGSASGGIEFDGPMLAYEVRFNDKKKRVNLSFKVKASSETYTCSLTLSSIENVTLTISSFNRQSISYFGTIGPIKEAK